MTRYLGGIRLGALVAQLPCMLADTPLNALTGQILGAAIEVHRNLGPGLLESTYMTCLQFELSTPSLKFVAQRTVPILYKGMELDANYRIDLLVENLVVVEVKSLDRVLGVHEAQILTYMRLTGSPAGLLINFNVAKLIDGVKRLMNPTWPNAVGGAVNCVRS